MGVPETAGSGERGSFFTRFTSAVAHGAGRPLTFCLSVLMLIAWAATGPVFEYSENWQLVVNTATSVITFLMVFLIQSTQNRDAYAVQLKLDELIRAVRGAHTELLDIENLSEERLCELRDLYAGLAKKARAQVENGMEDTGTPPVEIHRRQS
jgi:low affinity Fe/Cu permease